jgi:steroid 5-alpha reductase family enzyme
MVATMTVIPSLAPLWQAYTWNAALQCLGFLLSYSAGSEVYYDVFGALGFLLCTVWTLLMGSQIAPTIPSATIPGSSATIGATLKSGAIGSGALDPTAMLLSLIVCLWAVRLGAFLGYRISVKNGHDVRFDQVRNRFLNFGVYWFMQFLWISVTFLPVGLVNLSRVQPAPLLSGNNLMHQASHLLGIDRLPSTVTMLWEAGGLIVFLMGWGLEIVADWQKMRFKQERAARQQPDRWISSGLYAYSRHPNYLGEILLWWAIFAIALPRLLAAGLFYALISLASPIFVTHLVRNVSGVKLLEDLQHRKYASIAGYSRYVQEVPVLLPRLTL